MDSTTEYIINSKGILTSYSGSEDVLYIPESVKGIGKDVFSYSKGEYIREVIIPEGVTEIQANAFNMSNIQKVVLPSTLTKIGCSAFTGCRKLKEINIPEGIEVIEEDCFSFSGLEKVCLPNSIRVIGIDAFRSCDKLKTINFPDINALKIGECAFTGCTSLVDERGMLILQNRLFTYHQEDNAVNYVRIPDTVIAIERNAFDEYRTVHLEMPIDCPVWQTFGEPKRYGFANSIINRSGSSISFRNQAGEIIAKIVLATEEETDPKKNRFILAIRCSEAGKFDFMGYDSMFSVLSKAPNRLQMALVRLRYPYALSDEMKEAYLAYLKKQGAAAGILLMDNEDYEALHFLGDQHVFTASAMQKMIEHAETKHDATLNAWLLEYNQSQCGAKNTAKKKEALDEFRLPSEAPVLSAAEWRKIFNFTYAGGTVKITGYRGNDKVVTFPEKIGSKFLTALGAETFDYNNSKKVKIVIVPGWITNIESGAFSFAHGMQIEIQEGIEELPVDTFFAVHDLTIKLPRSLKTIGKQFGNSPENTIQLAVPERSAAEEFCKQYHLNYTTYLSEEQENTNHAAQIRERLSAQNKVKAEKRAASPWKKPKPGTKLVSRYLGNGTAVSFPTEVDEILIEGIANTAGETPENYKALVSVVIPEGYSSIGSKAFAGCENLEMIQLPTTLTQIGTGAFAGCKKLKELVINENISFSGSGFFENSAIQMLIIETNPQTRIPSHLFYECQIGTLVVLGGDFKSGGCVFEDTCLWADAKYAKAHYKGNFPQSVYCAGKFATSDIKGLGEINLTKIHPLIEFDENMISDEAIRSRISKWKKHNKSV